MNGIPVVASNRGALPEVVGVSDLLKELPGWLTADSREMPSEKEIQGWVETIERLWDEPAYYQAVASELRERSDGPRAMPWADIGLLLRSGTTGPDSDCTNRRGALVTISGPTGQP